MDEQEPLRVAVGYDARERDAYDICVWSLKARAKRRPVQILPLRHKHLRDIGLFRRPWIIEGNGQFVDAIDGKPFSTEFSHTRFLLPAFYAAHGITSGWAVFVDADFLFGADPAELFDIADESKAVMVVKHRFAPPESQKMDGMAQVQYSRKNWSSLILWNLGHKANLALTADRVNSESGNWLHNFRWLSDDLIGELPETWNWLAGHSPTTGPAPAGTKLHAIHYTDGGPWFEDRKDCPLGHYWTRENIAMARAQKWAPTDFVSE